MPALRFSMEGIDLVMVFVVARYRITVIGHVEKQVASHDTETDQAYFVFMFTHFISSL